MSGDNADAAPNSARVIVSEFMYQQASRQLNIALASYCHACEARNLLYPEGMLGSRPGTAASAPDLDLYNLVKAKGLQFVLDTIKHVNLDTEMHRCSASLLLIIVQSLVYCTQQLTFTDAEFELEAMQSRALDDPSEWPKNALKQMLMMDGVNAMLALVYKTNVADIQATAISCITCLVQLSRYAAGQLICPVQMFVVASRDEAKQRHLRRRPKEKRTVPLGSRGAHVPTGLGIMLAAMKLHRNKYTVSAAVAHAIGALLDQNPDNLLQKLEFTQAPSVFRDYQVPQLRLFSTGPSRQAAGGRRWELLDQIVSFLKRWNRFVDQAAGSTAQSSILTPGTAHQLILCLLFRLITQSKSAAMYIGSDQDNVAIMNAALAVHAKNPELHEQADAAIAVMESYQRAYSVPSPIRRPPSPVAALRSPHMPEVLYPSPIRSRPSSPATSQSPTASAGGRAANIARLMQTDFTALQRMKDAASPSRPRPVSAKPLSRQEVHFQRVREVYQHGGPRTRSRPRRADQLTSFQLSNTAPASTLAVSTSAEPRPAAKSPNHSLRVLRRSQTLPQLSEGRSNELSPGASNSGSSLKHYFENAEDFQSFQRILGGIGQVHC